MADVHPPPAEAAAPAATSAPSPSLPNDRARLVRLFGAIVILAAGFVPLEIATLVEAPARGFALVPAITSTLLVVAFLSARLARAGRSDAAVALFCFAMLAAVPLVALLIPWARDFITLMVLLPLTLAVAHLRGRLLHLLMGASIALMAGCTLFAAIRPDPADAPLAARLLLTSAAPTAVAVIVVVLIQQTSTRLREMLDGERAARAAALASEARYRRLFDSSPLPKWLYDLGSLRIHAVNDAAVRAYGYTRDELLRMTIKDLRPPEEIPKLLQALPSSHGTQAFGVWLHRKKDGTLFDVEITGHTFLLGSRLSRLVVAQDVTERRRLEDQLRQAQKMEAIGRLAGGVAHDFNNALSVILSYGEFVLEELPPGHPARADVDEMCSAGKRAAALTRQLLMFSRQQVLSPRVLGLDEVLSGMAGMLRRLIGEHIELVTVAAPSLGRVRVDGSSIEQVIMNLVVNARDAMPAGGRITFETANATLDGEAAARLGLAPGRYVMLSVADTGVGMDAATQARIFEPFYTTKPKGKGTGLGLSTVFGIVHQSGGEIAVESAPGRGATFRVYLPRCDDAAPPLEAPTATARARGEETVLLVEDEDPVRAAARGILERNGYRVLSAGGAAEALALCARPDAAIDLLLTDVVMPHMSGPELADRIVDARPGVRVICMSGYPADAAVRSALPDRSFAYLQKPIDSATLTRMVRDVLDGKRAA